MGIYFNPDNESFTQAGNSMVYVDKTGLIELLNRRLSTEKVLNSYELRIIKRLQFAALNQHIFCQSGRESARLRADALLATNCSFTGSMEAGRSSTAAGSSRKDASIFRISSGLLSSVSREASNPGSLLSTSPSASPANNAVLAISLCFFIFSLAAFSLA